MSYWVLVEGAWAEGRRPVRGAKLPQLTLKMHLDLKRIWGRTPFRFLFACWSPWMERCGQWWVEQGLWKVTRCFEDQLQARAGGVSWALGLYVSKYL